MKPKNILVTGGCGFIGHHLVEHLLKKTNWNITIIDRLDYASNGFDRLRDIKAFDDKRVKIFTWDLAMPFSSNIIEEIGNQDYFVHMAAGSHVDDSIENPRDFIMDNVLGTINLLEFARYNKPKKFIYFSTDEVFGTAPEGVNYKEGDRHNPGNPYSASKSSAESICIAYANTYKVPVMITNTMNVIGERQHPQKFLPKIINHAMNGETLFIHANKERTEAGKRHYIHARNVADATLFILREIDEFVCPVNASKGKFNIVGEREFDNLTFAKLVASNVPGAKLRTTLVDFHSSRPGHDLRYSLSGEKLGELGWKPPVNIEESIKRIVDWSLKAENRKWLHV